MDLFVFNLVKIYFVAFGVVIGGSLFGGLGAFLLRRPPMDTITDLAENLKIWALVVALGGTFDSFKVLFGGFEESLSPMIKQILYIITALMGAYTGSLFINWLFKGDLQ